MRKKFTQINETHISQKRTIKPQMSESEDSGCVGLTFILLLFLASLATCGSTGEPHLIESSTNNCIYDEPNRESCIALEDLPTNDGIEVMISLWVDKSGSATGVVPELSYEQLDPIFSVFQELESASLSIGKVGSSTRQDMAFLTFRKASSISVPERKAGQSPTDYQKALIRYKKRKSRSSNGSSFEDKIDDFEITARTILESPKNENQSLICEAYNVSKRQFSQKNVDANTVKIVVILSDMYHNGVEKCPLSLGDAEVVIVNRLSDPTRLLLHSNNNHFVSVEEAIDYIVSLI